MNYNYQCTGNLENQGDFFAGKVQNYVFPRNIMICVETKNCPEWSEGQFLVANVETCQKYMIFNLLIIWCSDDAD